MAIASFAPTAGVTLSVSTTSANAALPITGTPAAALVTNLGQTIVFVALGAAGVVATTASLPVLPGTQIALTITPNTNIAAIALAGLSAINVTVGT
jgi:hypothetical protein